MRTPAIMHPMRTNIRPIARKPSGTPKATPSVTPMITKTTVVITQVIFLVELSSLETILIIIYENDKRSMTSLKNIEKIRAVSKRQKFGLR